MKGFLMLLLLLVLLSCSPEEVDFTEYNLTVKTEIQNYNKKNEANRVRVKNMQALRKLPVPNKSRKEVFVLGYYEPHDGGGGNFYWDPDSNEKENGGTIIQTNTEETGRWKRIVDDEVILVEWFGAKGDGEHDDTEALQSALNSGYRKIIFNKDYLINSPVSLESNTIMLVNGRIKINKHGYRCLLIIGKRNIEIIGKGKIEGYGRFPDKNLSSAQGGGEKHFCFENNRNFPASYDDNNSGLGQFGGGYIGNGGIGIFIYGGENISIKDISIKGFNFSGISIGDPIKNNDPHHPISSNIQISCTIFNIYDSGISIFAAQKVMLDNSTYIYNIGHPDAINTDNIVDPGYGVTGRLVGKLGIPAKDVKISGKFKNCKRKGIDIHSGINFLISDFTIENCLITGVSVGRGYHQVENIKIQNGFIKDSGKQILSLIDRRGGIQLMGNMITVEDIVISNSGYTESLYVAGKEVLIKNITIQSGIIRNRSFTFDKAVNVKVDKINNIGVFNEPPLIRNLDGMIKLLNSNQDNIYCFDLNQKELILLQCNE